MTVTPAISSACPWRFDCSDLIRATSCNTSQLQVYCPIRRRDNARNQRQARVQTRAWGSAVVRRANPLAKLANSPPFPATSTVLGLRDFGLGGNNNERNSRAGRFSQPSDLLISNWTVFTRILQNRALHKKDQLARKMIEENIKKRLSAQGCPASGVPSDQCGTGIKIVVIISFSPSNGTPGANCPIAPNSK